MSDRARVRLDPSVSPEAVRDALVRVTGREVAVDRVPAQDSEVVSFRIGAGVLEADLPAMVIADPDDLSEREVSVKACERSRETMRALARELGGRYLGSDDNEGSTTAGGSVRAG